MSLSRFLLWGGLVAAVLVVPSLLPAQPKAFKPAYLKLTVPDDALVEIEGAKTTQTGPVRRYASPPLPVGQDYTYTVRVTWVQAGRIHVLSRDLRVRAGQETALDATREKADDDTVQVIYVPTEQGVVDKMLEMAGVTKNDVVYDLGCGDGRILVTAATKFKARGVGIDIDPERVAEATANVKKAGVEKLVEIRKGDALRVEDLDRATVVTLYMLPEFNARLKPILERVLKPGTRIVAHDYGLEGWVPQQQIQFKGPNRDHFLYMYKFEGPKKDE
jgi:uncharacterized protein (TIGR03000 family)